jgi:hypothetical protein
MWLSDGGQDYFTTVDADFPPAVDTSIHSSLSFPTALSPFQSSKLRHTAVAQHALANLPLDVSDGSELSPLYSEARVFTSFDTYDDVSAANQTTPAIVGRTEPQESKGPLAVQSPEVADPESTMELMRSMSQNHSQGGGALLLSSYGIVNPRTLRLSDPSLGLPSSASPGALLEHVTTDVTPENVHWKRTASGMDVAELPVPPTLSPPELPARLFTAPHAVTTTSTVHRALLPAAEEVEGIPPAKSTSVGSDGTEDSSVLLWECFGQPGTLLPGDLPKHVRRVLCSLPHADDNARHRARLSKVSDPEYQRQLISAMKRGKDFLCVFSCGVAVVLVFSHIECCRQHSDEIRERVRASQAVRGLCLGVCTLWTLIIFACVDSCGYQVTVRRCIGKNSVICMLQLDRQTIVLVLSIMTCVGESKVVSGLAISDILGVVLGGRTPALVYAERTGKTNPGDIDAVFLFRCLHELPCGGQRTTLAVSP